MWQRLTGSLWFVPGLIMLGMIGLAIAMVELSTLADREALARFPRLFGTGADGARSMLATIAGSMITVAGVTFSVTVVAVAQASSQYTSRILRNFMRDRANQVVLGVLTGVFTYCLVVLRTIRGGDELLFVPAFAVLLAVVLALLAIGCLIYFIHHITETLEAGSILARIRQETEKAVDRLFPDTVGDDPEDAAPLEQLRQGLWHPVPAGTTGYVQHVDADGLVRLAETWDAVLRMECGVGDFITEGMPLVSVMGGESSPNDDAVAGVGALFAISSYRTVHQDAAFGIRQMVDMALRALSPGVNDATTAVSCLDNIGAVLVRVAGRRIAEPYRYAGGTLRVIARGPTFETLLSTAVDEIRQSAAANGRLLVRILEVLALVARAATSDHRRRLVHRHATLVRAAAAHQIVVAEDQEPVMAAYERTLRTLATPV